MKTKGFISLFVLLSFLYPISYIGVQRVTSFNQKVYFKYQEEQKKLESKDQLSKVREQVHTISTSTSTSKSKKIINVVSKVKVDAKVLVERKVFKYRKLIRNKKLHPIEINDSELIKLSGYNFTMKKVASLSSLFKGIHIADNNIIKNVKKKIVRKKVSSQNNNKAGIENTMPVTSIAELATRHTISETVRNAIKRGVQQTKRQERSFVQEELVQLVEDAKVATLMDSSSNDNDDNVNSDMDTVSMNQAAPERFEGLVLYDYASQVKNGKGVMKESGTGLDSHKGGETRIVSEYSKQGHKTEGSQKLTAVEVSSQNDSRVNSQTEYVKDDNGVDKFGLLSDFQAVPYENSEDNVAVTHIRIYEAKIGLGRGDDLSSFQFIPGFDPSEYYEDYGQSVINIEEMISSNIAIIRGRIEKESAVPVNINLVLDKNRDYLDYELPVFDKSSFESFISNYNIREELGYILIELTDEVKKVSIDLPYMELIPLDENFIIDEDNYKFILFLGVLPGNAILSYNLKNNETIDRVIHVSSDEIYFEQSNFVRNRRDQFLLYERNLLGNKKELQISSKDISYFFNKDVKIERKGPNFFSLDLITMVYGSREYLNFSHLEVPMIVGKWDDKREIEVPSIDFYNQTVGELEYSCAIQITPNRKKMVDELYVSGEMGGDSLNIKIVSLDKDGSISDEVTVNSSKIFLFGEVDNINAIFNVKLKYIDKTSDYLQSICSKETFLIEQL